MKKIRIQSCLFAFALFGCVIGVRADEAVDSAKDQPISVRANRWEGVCPATIRIAGRVEKTNTAGQILFVETGKIAIVHEPIRLALILFGIIFFTVEGLKLAWKSQAINKACLKYKQLQSGGMPIGLRRPGITKIGKAPNLFKMKNIPTVFAPAECSFTPVPEKQIIHPIVL